MSLEYKVVHSKRQTQNGCSEEIHMVCCFFRSLKNKLHVSTILDSVHSKSKFRQKPSPNPKWYEFMTVEI